MSGRRKVKLLKTDCLANPSKYEWIVGKGCFERKKSKGRSRSPPRAHDEHEEKIGAKVKLLKKDCSPDKYKWIVGKGCFERVKAPSPKKASPKSPKLHKIWRKTGVLKLACLPPNRRWVKGAKGKPGFCEELELDLKPYEEKEEEKRPLSPPKASPKSPKLHKIWRKTGVLKHACLPPNRRWVKGAKGKPGYCEELELDLKPYEEKEEEKRPLSPPKAGSPKYIMDKDIYKEDCKPPNIWVKADRKKGIRKGYCNVLLADDGKKAASPPKWKGGVRHRRRRHVPVVFPSPPKPKDYYPFGRSPRRVAPKAYERPEVPFKAADLPVERKPSFLLRDAKDMPYRNCDSEPEEEIKDPDTSPILRIDHFKSPAEKEKLLAQYVCDLKQKARDKDVQEWMDAHPHLADTNKKVLSQKTYSWLSSFLSGNYQMGKLHIVTTMDPEIKAELQQFRFDRPVKAYRGIHFKINKIDLIKKLCGDRIKPKYYYHYKDDRVSSWAWNYQMAENFGKLGIFNFVLQHTFQPKDILVDLRLLHEYCAMRGTRTPDHITGLQDEIIILPGDYACEVFDAPFNKNELARTENIDAFKKLYDELLSRVTYLPYGGNYQGQSGGLYGAIGINSTYLLFNFKRKPDGMYNLEYCLLSPNHNLTTDRHTRKHQMLKADPSFYEKLNKTVKHFKHPDDKYMKAYLLRYDYGSEQCKNKCDRHYKSYDYDVYNLPYAIASKNMMSLVNIMIEDTLAIVKEIRKF